MGKALRDEFPSNTQLGAAIGALQPNVAGQPTGGPNREINRLATELNALTNNVASLQTELAGKAEGVHTHTQAQISGLATALAGKANTSHTHLRSQITGLVAALAGKAPSNHTHTQAQVMNLATALAGKSNTNHTHTQSQVTGLITALAGYSPLGHTHTRSQITGLVSALAARALTNHTHTQAQVSNLATALAGKSNTNHTHSQYVTTSFLITSLTSYSTTSHTHTQNQISGLTTALAARSRTTHTHTTAQVSNLAEFIRDTIGATLRGGTGITVTVSDVQNRITIDATAGGGGPTSGSFSGSATRLSSATRINNRDYWSRILVPSADRASMLASNEVDITIRGGGSGAGGLPGDDREGSTVRVGSSLTSEFSIRFGAGTIGVGININCVYSNGYFYFDRQRVTFLGDWQYVNSASVSWR